MADELNKPSRGTGDWDIPVNENFDKLEAAARAFIARGTSSDIDVGGVISPELIDGSGRTRPTAQLQSRSALSAPTNAESVVFNRAPVNDEAVQGTESVLTLLQSGIDPAMVMRRELDGQGGAYAHQLDAALGRFARINSNLSFEYDSVTDIPQYSVFDSDPAFSVNINSRPRRLVISHDGSGSNSGGVSTTVLTTAESLDEFQITFSGVSFTNNNGDNGLRFGIHEKNDPTTNLAFSGTGIIFSTTGNNRLRVIDNGNSSGPRVGTADFTQRNDFTIRYDGETVAALINGAVRGSTTFSAAADFSPVIKLIDAGSNTDGETVEVEQITVEPIGGTF
jgi:hypothetical protein